MPRFWFVFGSILVMVLGYAQAHELFYRAPGGWIRNLICHLIISFPPFDPRVIQYDDLNHL